MKSKIFWHATGYKEDLDRRPEAVEHFGITTVEAMSYGQIPIVFYRGRLTDVVEDGLNGYCWQTESELKEKTNLVISDENRMKEISEQAFIRSKDFSKEKFRLGLLNVIKSLFRN